MKEIVEKFSTTIFYRWKIELDKFSNLLGRRGKYDFTKPSSILYTYCSCSRKMKDEDIYLLYSFLLYFRCEIDINMLCLKIFISDWELIAVIMTSMKLSKEFRM